MLNVITYIFTYNIYTYLCKKINRNMARVKTKVFQIRASEEFMSILKSLSEKKGMSQANLIEYLVRKESDALQQKDQYEQDKENTTL